MLEPKYQKTLYGHENNFNLFIKIKERNLLPKVILLSGEKGIGKCTFAYHLINYLLSEQIINSEYLKNFSLDTNGRNYKLISQNCHPNFYLVEKSLDKKNIDISQVRELNNFILKTTFKTGIKIILVDEIESLNLNAVNAILKIIEEPTPNTYFLLTHNDSIPLIDTIKSRTLEFKLYLKKDVKKNILKNLLKESDLRFENLDKILPLFPYESPGTIFRYLNIITKEKINCGNKMSDQVLNLIDKYLVNKKKDYLILIKVLIENLYYYMFLNNTNNPYFIFNKNKISKKINQMINFNLDEKNIFFEIKNLIKKDA